MWHLTSADSCKLKHDIFRANVAFVHIRQFGPFVLHTVTKMQVTPLNLPYLSVHFKWLNPCAQTLEGPTLHVKPLSKRIVSLSCNKEFQVESVKARPTKKKKKKEVGGHQSTPYGLWIRKHECLILRVEWLFLRVGMLTSQKTGINESAASLW